MNLPVVSVITPTYNHQDYIAECIQSVIDQTYTNWELIIINDGSTDETVQKIEQFNEPRIQLINQPNQGIDQLAATYNSALNRAKGSLIAILEGDDYWHPQKLARQVKNFTVNPDLVLSFSQFQLIKNSGEVISTEPSSPPPLDGLANTPVGRAAYYLLQPDHLTFAFPVTQMINADALHQIGGFQSIPGLPLIDYPTLLALSLVGPWHFDEEILGFWRRHEKSTTQSQLPKILDQVSALGQKFIKENSAKLPVSNPERDLLHYRRAAGQLERAMLGHRLAMSQKDKKLAREFLNVADRLNQIAPPSKATLTAENLDPKEFDRHLLSKIRVSGSKLLATLGLPTEPIASFRRKPLPEALQVNEFDRLIDENTTPESLLIF